MKYTEREKKIIKIYQAIVKSQQKRIKKLNLNLRINKKYLKYKIQ